MEKVIHVPYVIMKIIDKSNVHKHLLMRTWTFDVHYFLSVLFREGDAFVAH